MFTAEALGENHLNHIPGPDIFGAPLNHANKIIPGKITGNFQFSRGSNRLIISSGSFQAGNQFVNHLKPVIVTDFGILLPINPDQGNNNQGILQIIVNQQEAGNHKQGIGKTDIITGGIRQQFKLFHHIVGKETDSAAIKCRQVGNRSR